MLLVHLEKFCPFFTKKKVFVNTPDQLVSLLLLNVTRELLFSLDRRIINILKVVWMNRNDSDKGFMIFFHLIAGRAPRQRS